MSGPAAERNGDISHLRRSKMLSNADGATDVRSNLTTPKAPPTRPGTMNGQYSEIADRLKAYRMGSGMSAAEVARRLGISRTALYRFEKGELAKIETLEKLSDLLGVSMPALLGVGIEYMPSAVTIGSAFVSSKRQPNMS